MQQRCPNQSRPNSGVEEKLTQEKTGHRSDVLLTKGKPSGLENKGSKLLGPCTSVSVTETTSTSSARELLRVESNRMLQQ